MSTYHCFTKYNPADVDAIRRNTIAQASWKEQPWTEIPVRDEDLPRLWKEEGKQFVYLRDVFDFACAKLQPEDILIYTNADIHCRCDCAFQVEQALASMGACYAFRRDFGRLEEPLKPEDYIHGGAYCGSDLAAFRVRWWSKTRNEMPDMILGLEAWDPCFRLLADRSNRGKPAIVRDVIGHERHDSFWERKENRHRLKGQIHCRKLAARWLWAHGVNPGKHGLSL